MTVEQLNILPAGERPSRLNPQKSAIQILGLGAMVVGARLAVDLTSAASYVYPDFDFGQFWAALLFFLVMLIIVAVIAVVRLFQRRFIEGLALLAFLCVPFLFKDAFDRHDWKFQTHKSEYQSVVQNETSPPPRYHVFNWGNRNTQLMGGGVIFEAVVYDESDEIARAPDARSSEWVKRRADSLPADYWILRTPGPYPACKRLTKPLGDHFYYLSEEC